MGRVVAYIALQQFCEEDVRPRQALEAAGFEVRHNTLGRRLRREEMAEALQGADAVLAGVEPYDAALLAALPRLRCISRCGTGTDSIDLDAAARQGIAVYTTPNEVVEPVAQLTIAMILALARNLPLHAKDAWEGRWTKRTGFLLAEWTIGLVGFGRIGRTLARHLSSFRPRIAVCDPFLQQRDIPEGVELRELAVLLAESDLVSLHVSRDRELGALIGRNELAMMKRGSYLVNTARGFLVDEAALLEALTSHHLAGAALDVFRDEPYTGPLATLPQVLCTPHVATLTKASRAAMEYQCAKRVVEHFQRQDAAVGTAAGRAPIAQGAK